MFSSGPIRRAAPRLRISLQSRARQLSTESANEQAPFRWTYLAAAAGTGAAAYWGLKVYLPSAIPVDAEAPKFDTSLIVELPVFEPPRPISSNKEENRDVISSQHAQTKQSWENPGVYAWGLNDNKVVSPDSDERYIKYPRRIPFFDGVLLRDIKLDKSIGAAIDENGDLLQWGKGYSPDVRKPEVTLKGRNLRSLSISDDRIVALSDGGSVYSVSGGKKDQAAEPKLKETSWFWSTGTTNIGCRNLTPADLGVGEKVVSIAGGLDHVLMLTSRGRVFSAAASSNDFPKYGQLGIPGLTWYSRPPGPYDQPHEIKSLKKIRQIAAGDTHSLALDNEGRVFSFGDNAHGQLGITYNPDTMNLDSMNITTNYIDTPTELPIARLYSGSAKAINVRAIAAGGQNSFFMVQSKRVGVTSSYLSYFFQ